MDPKTELPMEPMAASIGSAADASGIAASESNGFINRLRSIFTRSSSKDTIAPYQELIISHKVFQRSVNCVRFAVFVDSMTGTIEQPNYRKSINF